jgi:hypothetical protein
MATYYALQRSFGALRSYSPSRRFEAAKNIFDRIIQVGGNPTGSTFLEVGTGRVPVVPMALWLMGARQTITVDLHSYLCPRLTMTAARYFARNTAELERVFGHRLNTNRLARLRQFVDHRKGDSLISLLDFFNVEYRAPADAASTGLRGGSVDYHISYTVLEHIEPNALMKIWREAHRVLCNSGRAVHFIDYSDHFSHSDRSIDAVHFLRFDDHRWKKLTNNPFMYANRLRDDDHAELAHGAGFVVERHEPVIDPDLLPRLLRNEVPLDHRFSRKSASTLATTAAWIVLRPSATHNG